MYESVPNVPEDVHLLPATPSQQYSLDNGQQCTNDAVLSTLPVSTFVMAQPSTEALPKGDTVSNHQK